MALIWIQDAVDAVMQGIRHMPAPQSTWDALCHLPGMQAVQSLQQLEDVIGTKGEGPNQRTAAGTCCGLNDW